MPASMLPGYTDYLRFLPEILLSLFGIAVMLLEAAGNLKKSHLGVVALVGIVFAFLANMAAYSQPGPAFQNMLIIDGYGTFFRAVVLVVGFLCILTSLSYLDREGANTGEFHALILFSLVGQCIMVTAADLIMVFIGLEISSIATCATMNRL